jgi:hypothetical protein
MSVRVLFPEHSAGKSVSRTLGPPMLLVQPKNHPLLDTDFPVPRKSTRSDYNRTPMSVRVLFPKHSAGKSVSRTLGPPMLLVQPKNHPLLDIDFPVPRKSTRSDYNLTPMSVRVLFPKHSVGKSVSRTLGPRRLHVISNNSALLDTDFPVPRKSTRSDYNLTNMTPMSVRVLFPKHSAGKSVSRTLGPPMLLVQPRNHPLLDIDFLVPRKSTRSDYNMSNMTPMSVRFLFPKHSVGKSVSRTLGPRMLLVQPKNHPLLDTDFPVPRKSTRSDYIPINMTPMSVRVLFPEHSAGKSVSKTLGPRVLLVQPKNHPLLDTDFPVPRKSTRSDYNRTPMSVRVLFPKHSAGKSVSRTLGPRLLLVQPKNHPLLDTDFPVPRKSTRSDYNLSNITLNVSSSAFPGAQRREKRIENPWATAAPRSTKEPSASRYRFSRASKIHSK